MFGPIGSTVTVKWHFIGIGLVELSFISSKAISVALFGPIGITLTVKWHWIDIGLVEWSFIGSKVI